MIFLLVSAVLTLTPNVVVSKEVITKQWCTSNTSKLIASDYYYYTNEKCQISNAPTDKKLDLRLISERSDDRCTERSYRLSRSRGNIYISVKNGCDGYFEVSILEDKGTWNAWSKWSTCSKQCRSTRSRTCSTGHDSDCEGNVEESKECSGGNCEDKESNLWECGIENLPSGFRVVGGVKANKCQYPWMVQIYNRVTNEICGGSIQDRRHILTAGHCVVKDETLKAYPTSYFEIYSGSSKVPESLRGVTKHKVDKITYHKDYYIDEYEIRNDVAVIRLTKDIKFDTCHRPLCLSNGSKAVVDNKDCRVMGWGRTSNRYDDTATDLQWTKETAVSKTACRKEFGSEGSKNRFCAMGEHSGSCSGDSGGPFTCKHEDGKFYQYGLVSAGRPGECGVSYTLYYDTYVYLDWITEAMRQ